MLPEALNCRELVAKGFNIIISLKSSHGEIMLTWTYAVEA